MYIHIYICMYIYMYMHNVYNSLRFSLSAHVISSTLLRFNGRQLSESSSGLTALCLVTVVLTVLRQSSSSGLTVLCLLTVLLTVLRQPSSACLSARTLRA